MAGQRRETGRKEDDSCAGLPGFKSGTIVEVFQIAGILLFERERLKRCVRKITPFSPRCFRCSGESWSGPKALEALELLIALAVSAGVMGGGVSTILFSFLVVVRAVLLLLCLTTEEYWALKELAIFFALDSGFPLKLMD